MDTAGHWTNVWTTKGPQDVSWFESRADTSLEVITGCSDPGSDSVVDVGGGASPLVDGLLDAGYGDVTVLDVAPEALERARRRLGPRGAQVGWIAADVTTWTPARRWSVWHDRAAFHFLDDDAAVAAYRERLLQALEAGGRAVIATFALDGPRKCSGLWVRRYGPDELQAALGKDLVLQQSFTRVHTTPAGVDQRFHWGVLRRI